MTNIKSVRIAALSFLFLMIPVFAITNAFISKAQNQPTAPILEGTEWQVTVKGFYTVYNIDQLEDIEVLYVFGDKGRVGVSISVLSVNLPKTYFDPNTLTWKTTLPTPNFKGRVDPKGTYKQSGNSIRIEFSDHIITAKFKGNYMEGEATSKKSNETAQWTAELSSGTVKNNSDTIEKSVPKQPTKDSVVKDFLKKADEFRRQGKYLEAIENYTSAIELNPGNMDKLLAYSNRGHIKLELKDYKGAYVDYRIVIKAMYDSLHENSDTAFATRMNNLDVEYLKTHYVDIAPFVFNNYGVVVDRLDEGKDDACSAFKMSCRLGNSMGCENAKKNCK